MKEEVSVVIFEDSKEIKFTGRCLGFLSPEEYQALISNSKLRRSLFDVETKSIPNISKPIGNDISGPSLNSHRLAFAVKKMGEKEVMGKKVIISSPLEYVSVESKDNSEVGFTGKDCYMMVERVFTED